MTPVSIALTPAPAPLPTPPTEPPTVTAPATVDVPADATVPADSPLGRVLARRARERANPVEVVVSHDSMI